MWNARMYRSTLRSRVHAYPFDTGAVITACRDFERCELRWFLGFIFTALMLWFATLDEVAASFTVMGCAAFHNFCIWRTFVRYAAHIDLSETKEDPS
jgi:hypothetical protein